MASSISVNFKSLETAISNAKAASKRATQYADALKADNKSELSNITGGCNGNVEAAYDSINEKITELKKVCTKFSTFATSLETFEENVRDADEKLKNKIDGYAKTFAKEHNIETNAIESAWNWLCDGVSSLLNQTELGQWINNSLRKVGDWFGDRWDDCKEWYALEGGEFWVNIGLGLLAVAAAAFTIFTAGTGFLAVVAIIGAAIAIINAAAQISFNIVALAQYDEDPAWSRRNGKISKLSESLTAYFPNSKVASFIGKTIDVVDSICTIISFTDFATKACSGITGKTSMFQKYLGKNGVLDSYFMVDNGTDSMKASRQFNGLIGQWEELDKDGKVVRHLVTGKPMTVNFAEKNSKFRWDFKTGVRNLFGEEDGLKGYQIVKGKVETDLGVKIKGFKNTISSVSSTVSDFKINGFKATLKDIHTSHVEKHYGSIPKIGEAGSFLDKFTAIKANSAIVWGKTTESTEYLLKTFKSDLGFDSFLKDAKQFKKVDFLSKTKIGKVIYVGEQLNNVQKSFTNVGKLVTGNFDEIYKPVTQFNKFFGGVATITEGDSISVGSKSNRYDNWNEILHRRNSSWSKSN